MIYLKVLREGAIGASRAVRRNWGMKMQNWLDLEKIKAIF